MSVKEIKRLIASYKEGKIDQYEYMSKLHEYNKILLYFRDRITGSNIKKIEIQEDGVLFTISPSNIRIVTDGSCRSVPFEYLNFSDYEPGDAEMVYQLLDEDFVVFDIGAHIGWYFF